VALYFLGPVAQSPVPLLALQEAVDAAIALLLFEELEKCRCSVEALLDEPWAEALAVGKASDHK
jgi:hypothetical protein